MGPYLQVAELVRKLKMYLPVTVTLSDPITGAPFVLERDNVLSDLIVDTVNLGAEVQTLSAHFVEFARAQRACEVSAAKAEAAYRRWKSQAMAQYRKDKIAAGEKAPTVAQQEAHYRGLPDYEEMEHEPARLTALAGLFGDIKQAFRIKSDVMRNQIDNLRGYESVARTANRTEESWPKPGPVPPPPRKS